MLERGKTAEETAVPHNRMLTDPGPYKTWDDAYDAMADLMDAREERE